MNHTDIDSAVLRIILIGFMGSGKTTLGHALAEKIGWMYYDLDWYIENRRHSTVPALFEEVGEEGFRRIEHNMLHEVAEFEHVVIGCGGGTPCYFDNIDYLNRQGLTIYLRASVPVLAEHLRTARRQRPLWHSIPEEEQCAQIEKLLKEREPWYMKARHVIDIDRYDNIKDRDTTVDTLMHIITRT